MPWIRNKVFWLIVISIAVRLAFGCMYPIKRFPDTAGYFQTGRQLVSGDYNGYTGKRPPVYPLLVAAAGFNRHALVWIQAAMGMGISVLLYLIFSRLVKSETVGFLLGLTYAFNPSQLMFEFSLSSETTCTFFLTLLLYLFFRFTARKVSPSRLDLLFLGLVCSICVLTRAQFQTLPVFFALFLAYYLKAKLGESIWKAAVFLVPVAVLAGSWSGFQYRRIGQFTVSPDLGYGIMNHTIKFIEFAPERYESIKQVLIRHREYKIQTKGEAYGSVAASLPELLEMTGLTYAGLSRKFAEIAFATIREKPFLYLASVFRGFVRFFKPIWPGRLFGIRPAISQGGTLLKVTAALYAFILLACTFTFFVFPILVHTIPRWRESFGWTFEITFIYVLVFGTALIQALVEFGENARYKTSVEPLIICMAVWIIIKLFIPAKKGIAVEA
ncbi:MAG TPA: hypothetical protein VM123_17065 [archaeon]|nr:hypothetical protein [archaeon]